MPGLHTNLTMAGAGQLVSKLKELDRKMQRSISGKALRVGARIIQTEAKALCPERTGKLAASIKVRTGRSKPGRRTVLVQTGKGQFTGHEYYGSFVELGHLTGRRPTGTAAAAIQRRRQRAGLATKGRRKVPGEHFLKHAAEEKAGAAAEAVADELRRLMLDAVGV